MRFKPGQEITPTIKSEQWSIFYGGPMPIPEFGKVYTVLGYPDDELPEMVSIEELGERFVYWEQNFEPLVPIEKLEEDLQEVVYMEDEALLKRIEEVLKSYE
jgi:hypothetical protein